MFIWFFICIRIGGLFVVLFLRIFVYYRSKFIVFDFKAGEARWHGNIRAAISLHRYNFYLNCLAANRLHSQSDVRKFQMFNSQPQRIKITRLTATLNARFSLCFDFSVGSTERQTFFFTVADRFCSLTGSFVRVGCVL